VASLDAAVAFTEVDDIAVMVGDDLEFDMAGLFDILFDIDIGNAESLFCRPLVPSSAS